MNSLAANDQKTSVASETPTDKETSNPTHTVATPQDQGGGGEKRATAAAAAMVPMTREQYEAQQSTVREVYDEETGRTRLVRGTGEIIERMVSRQDHERINQTATRGDGAGFSRTIFSKLRGMH